MEAVTEKVVKKYIIYAAFPALSLLATLLHRSMMGDTVFGYGTLTYLAAVWLIPACISLVMVGSKFRYFFMPSFWVFSLTLYICVFYPADYYKTTRPLFELLDVLGFPEVFLSVITINLALILLSLEAWFRGVPRWAFVFPGLYFGCYFCLSLISHAQYYYVMHSIYAVNSRSEITFKPDQQVLKLTIPSQRDTVLQFLFFHYGFSSVDLDLFNKSTLRTVLGNKQTCYRVRNDEYRRFRGLGVYVKDLHFKDKQAFLHVADGTCIIVHPALSEEAGLSISIDHSVRKPFFSFIHQYRFVMRASMDNASVLFEIGKATPLSWIPKLYVKSRYVRFDYDYASGDNIEIDPPDFETAQMIAEQIAMALGLSRVDSEHFELKTIDDAYLDLTVQALEQQAKKDFDSKKN